jgi:predicted dehydrogenase
MAPIRVGLIGCGNISAKHAQGYSALQEILQVVAVCDSNEAAARACGADLGAGHAFTDYHALLEADLVDAVDVCLPHHLHAPVTVDCLEAGLHVLVEKPIATTLDEADRMVDAAQHAGKILMVGHNERYDPQYQEMKRLVDAGTLGEIFCARADHNQNFQRAGEHWLKHNRQAGGGVLIGSGIHRIDLLRWLVGEITRVFNVQVAQPDRLEGEACALTTVVFANGAIGELASNWAVRCFPWYELMWLFGSAGNVHNASASNTPGGIGGVLYVESARDPSTANGYRRIEVRRTSSFTEEIRHFGTCIRDGTQPLTSGVEGRQTLAVVLAAYQSAQQNRPVTVEQPQHPVRPEEHRTV